MKKLNEDQMRVNRLNSEDKQYVRECEYCHWMNKIKNKWGRVICKNCRHYVYIDAETKFKYKMKEVMNKCKSSS